ncbi:glucose 1-dehydrogenase [Scytonema sp. NUACC26]|uniref:glucose 1-dehydrogenase n=1 Tax=Scytonema sp. NUACC26 TaxID=3140176 RepID=UPI0034DBEC4D
MQISNTTYTATPLAGKIALVTGASRGIGQGIAERLGRAGATVVVNYAGSQEDANKVVATIQSFGSNAIALQANMGKVEEIRRLFQETIDRCGQLDILVNNAGIGSMAAIADVTEEEYNRVFDVNVRGVLFAMQEAARRMNQNGRIVTISSSTTLYPDPGVAVYAASKAAIELLTQVLAKEVGNRGITVNTIMPGPTVPGMFANLPPEVQQQAAASSPFNRLGTPQDIANIIAFLVSEEARWLTGQDICANGGARI